MKYKFKIEENNKTGYIEFITDKSPEWTEEQYTRHRINCKMELISHEIAEEKEPISREVELG